MERKATRMAVEERIERLAASRFGVVSRAQLMSLGLGAEAIRHRLRSGRLRQVHRGVYAVGPAPLTREGRWTAAVLACGDEAVLSHLSAAALWGIRPADPAVIDISLASRGKRSRQGIRVHRPSCLDTEDTTCRHGIPVTTVARTLIDLAVVLGARSRERLLDEAEYLKLLDPGELQAALERNRTRTGASRLEATLRCHEPGTTRTRSALEEAFLLLVRRAALPQPEVNARLGPWTVDFLWRERRLVVETDGGRSHDRARQRERDSARDAWLVANHYRPLRLTWPQVTERPEEVLAALEAATRQE
jgi:very-short-patch-repair endonuclease